MRRDALHVRPAHALLGIVLLAALTAVPSSAVGCYCGESASSPVWSPDGTSVLYTATYETASFGETTGVSEAAIARPDATVVIGKPGLGGLPAFSPDGRRIASWQGGPPSIWVVAVDA